MDWCKKTLYKIKDQMWQGVKNNCYLRVDYSLRYFIFCLLCIGHPLLGILYLLHKELTYLLVLKCSFAYIFTLITMYYDDYFFIFAPMYYAIIIYQPYFVLNKINAWDIIFTHIPFVYGCFLPHIFISYLTMGYTYYLSYIPLMSELYMAITLRPLKYKLQLQETSTRFYLDPVLLFWFKSKHYFNRK
jgi:hypothetical protein